MSIQHSVPGGSPVAAAGRFAGSWGARAGAIAAIHLGALSVLAWTEYGWLGPAIALLFWAFLNCFFLAVLRRPGISAALSLSSRHDPGRAVAVQVHHSLDGDQLLRHPDRRFRHRQLPAFDLPGPAHHRHHRGAADRAAAGGDLAYRSVPRLAADRFAWRRYLRRGRHRPVARSAGGTLGAVPGRQSHLDLRALGRHDGLRAVDQGLDRHRHHHVGSASRGVDRALPRVRQAAQHHHGARRGELRRHRGSRHQGAAELPRPFPARSTARRAHSASRVPAARPGTRNTTCSPDCRRAPTVA